MHTFEKISSQKSYFKISVLGTSSIWKCRISHFCRLKTWLFTKLANSKVWELPDRLFWHFLQKHSTSLALLKKKFGCFWNFGSDHTAILLSCPERILHGNVGIPMCMNQIETWSSWNGNSVLMSLNRNYRRF